MWGWVVRRTAAGWLVALGLVVAGCADGGASNDGTDVSSATTTVAVATSTSAAPTSTTLPSAAAEPSVSVETEGGVAAPDETEIVSEPPVVEQAGGEQSPRPQPDPNPFDCVGEICPNPYTDAPPPDPNADPRNPQISWCGTDKNVHNRGATVYDDGSWSPWTQFCADQFDAVNDPPNPPGTMGGGGAVAGPCRPDEEGTITYTPDMRKQRCSGGHWVYIR